MANKLAPLLRCAASNNANFHFREFHFTNVVSAGQEWRKTKGLPKNPNAYGPLTDGPDYSFIDGRPTPPGNNKIRRAMKQLEISKKIMQLSNEVDFAVELRKQKDIQEEETRKSIIERKLLPKGQKEF